MDWVIIVISGAIMLALAVWTVLREDRSTARRGRHRGRSAMVRVVPGPGAPAGASRPAAGA